MPQHFTSTRRNLLRRSALVAVGLGAVPAGLSLRGAAQTIASSTDTPFTGPGTMLVLLGTASGPPSSRGRRGISSALVVNGHVYVVDLGHSSFDQFMRTGLDIRMCAAYS